MPFGKMGCWVSIHLSVFSVQFFFYNSKNFCLGGGKEHRSLKIVKYTEPSVHCLYTENGSKNRSGALNQLHLDNKTVPIFPCSGAGVAMCTYLIFT